MARGRHTAMLLTVIPCPPSCAQHSPIAPAGAPPCSAQCMGSSSHVKPGRSGKATAGWLAFGLVRMQALPPPPAPARTGLFCLSWIVPAWAGLTLRCCRTHRGTRARTRRRPPADPLAQTLLPDAPRFRVAHMCVYPCCGVGLSRTRAQGRQYRRQRPAGASRRAPAL